jgi:ABC-type branched-subunit amino acid transport system substrate-binding protein
VPRDIIVCTRRPVPSRLPLCTNALEEAITATKSTDSDKLADYCRTHTFQTVVGDIKFGSNGEWVDPRVMEVQFQNVQGMTCSNSRT